MTMQLLSNFGVFPAVELLKPGSLYRPELGPSVEMLLVTGVTAAVLTAVAWLAWRGRISMRSVPRAGTGGGERVSGQCVGACSTPEP